MNLFKKIVIIGGESTGKSTLTNALARHFESNKVDEYARIYLEQRGHDYCESDLLEIAKGQLILEEKVTNASKDFVFIDTDLNVIKVWSEHKYNRCNPWILNQIASRHYDGYLLTSPDFPWQNDPLREHPEPHLRKYFYTQYLDIVMNTNVPFQIVTGNEIERLNSSIEFLKSIQ